MSAETLERHHAERKASARFCSRSGEPWSQEEDRAITAIDRPRDFELSRQLGRTMVAIEQRRYVKVGGGRRGGRAIVVEYDGECIACGGPKERGQLVCCTTCAPKPS